MCTISCIVNFKDNFTRNMPYYKLLLRRMSEPSAAERIDEHAAMACSSGFSPISKICEGYQFVIVFDGELFGTEELYSHLCSLGYCFILPGDAELALNAYIHYGEKCVQYINGNFSFIIYDTMRRRVFAASDGFSSRPLFYAQSGDEILLCSNICGILSHQDITAKISAGGLRELLSFPSHLSGSIFEGIYMIPPSHTLKIDGGEISLSPYCRNHTDKLSEQSAEDEITLLLTPKNLPSGDIGVILTGKAEDDLLCSIIASKKMLNFQQISTYSFTDMPEISRINSCAHTQIPLCENALREGLKASVCACGLPVLSETDYLLPLIFSHLPKSLEQVFFAMPSNFAPDSRYLDFMLKNNAVLPPVKETLALSGISGESENFFNFGKLIAEHFGINLKTPYLNTDICHAVSALSEDSQTFLRNIAYKEDFLPMPHAQFDTAVYDGVRHILLEIIADNSSPISAFFDKGVLLRLCEGSFDVSDISASALIAYIIKLNIWFSEFRPRII